MRTQTFISSMVGVVAAAALAGSANASITQVYNQADITTQTGSDYLNWSQFGGEYSEVSCGTLAVTDNSYNHKTGGFGWAVTVDSNPNNGYAGWLLLDNDNGANVGPQGFPQNELVFNNSCYQSFGANIIKISFSKMAGSPDVLPSLVGTYIQADAYAEGASSAKMMAYNQNDILLGFVTVDFAQGDGPKFIGLESSSADISYFTMEMTSTQGSIFSMSGISMAPAPGAAALIGLAGLVTGRRRRN